MSEQDNNNDNQGWWIGCLATLTPFAIAIYQIVNMVKSRAVNGYGFLDILKYSAMWLVGAFVAYIIFCFVAEQIFKLMKYYKRIRIWENGEFKQFCSNHLAGSLAHFNENGDFDRKLEKVEQNLEMMKSRLRDVQKMVK